MQLRSMELHSMELRSPNLCFFVSTKFNARNIIFNQRPVVINKINSNSGKICKNYYHKYNIHCAGTIYLFSFSFSARVILANLTSSIVSVHSSINLSSNFFLHLQFS